MKLLKFYIAIVLAIALIACNSDDDTNVDEDTIILIGDDGSPRFNLTWIGSVDLDLHVTDPIGETISFANFASDSGGVLDVDCTGDCDEINSENITWVNGGPDGEYSFFVNYFFGNTETSFTLVVRDEDETIEIIEGNLSSGSSTIFTYTK